MSDFCRQCGTASAKPTVTYTMPKVPANDPI